MSDETEAQPVTARDLTKAIEDAAADVKLAEAARDALKWLGEKHEVKILSPDHPRSKRLARRLDGDDLALYAAAQNALWGHA